MTVQELLDKANKLSSVEKEIYPIVVWNKDSEAYRVDEFYYTIVAIEEYLMTETTTVLRMVLRARKHIKVHLYINKLIEKLQKFPGSLEIMFWSDDDNREYRFVDFYEKSPLWLNLTGEQNDKII